MGAWGPKLYQDDIAQDVRDTYKDRLRRGKTTKEITEELIEEYSEEIEDIDDGPIFWFALADIQWDYGRLLPKVKENAIKWIEDGSDIRRWEEEGTAKEVKVRKEVLEKLKNKLKSPMPEEKKVSQYRLYKCQWKIGDVYAYKMNSEYAKERGLYGMNYVRNTQVDKNKTTTTQNKLINDQNDTSGTGGNFRYGLYSASHNACETIAVHNAKVLKGINSNLSSTMLEFQMSNAMIEPTGYFGSNPYSIGRVLSNSGISYSRVGLNEMTESGTYIISYWNGTPCMSSLHTVAVEYNGISYFTYNYKGGVSYKDPSEYASNYICGYYLGR